jgi:hypothetical protein
MTCMEGQCVADSSNNANSNTNNNTIDPNAKTRFVRIEDTTTGDPCDLPDPGSDIFAVSLEDSDGTAIAWATEMDHAIDDTNNDYTQVNNVLDAQPVDDCPASFEPTSVTSLSCGGWVVVAFYASPADIGGVPEWVREGMSIRVWEWGGQCGASSDDQYEVYTCEEELIPANSAWTCTNILGNGSGETAHDVQLP